MVNRAMKDSGVQAIGRIPENWEVVKLKHKYKFTTGFTPLTKNDEYYDDVNGFPWATISDLTKQSYLTQTQKKISKDFVNKVNPALVKKGSLLFSFKLSVGTKGIAGIDLYTNEAIASFYSEDLKFNNYLYYSSMFIESNSNENIYGAKILNQELIKNAKLPYPPIKEQKKIAAFLDEKVSHIDNIIEDTKKSIENLKAYKQSLITETVTKGLNPNVEMKDSGIEWVGKIPHHWNKEIAKRIFNKEQREIKFNDIITCFRDGEVTLRKNRRTDGFTVSTKEIGYQGIKKGDLVIHQMDAFAGAIGVSDSNGKSTPVYTVCTSGEDYNNYYYAYLLRSYAKVGYIESMAKGIRERSTDFRYATFSITPLLVPPIAEQNDIVSFLDSNIHNVDELISQKEKLITELEAYKKSLIYEYVTGKKEVK